MRTRIPWIATSALIALVIGCGGRSEPHRHAKSPDALRPPSGIAPRVAHAKSSQHERWIEHVIARSNAEKRSEPRASEERADASLHAFERPPSVLNILTSPGITFMTDYLRSEAYATAVKDCAAIAGENEEKRSKCLTQARERFSADGMRFRKDDDGELWLVVYKRRGDELSEAHTSKVEVVNVAPNSVTLAIRGPETGQRPIFKGVSRVVLDVPDSYSIRVNDVNFGRLVYDAKFGFDRR